MIRIKSRGNRGLNTDCSLEMEICFLLGKGMTDQYSHLRVNGQCKRILLAELRIAAYVVFVPVFDLIYSSENL